MGGSNSKSIAMERHTTQKRKLLFRFHFVGKTWRSAGIACAVLLSFYLQGTAASFYFQEQEREIDANDQIENALRDKLLQPERVLDVIGVNPGMIIGEAGAGRGYFAFKLARRVGASGTIYANDINSGDLQILRRRASEMGLTNIETILGILKNIQKAGYRLSRIETFLESDAVYIFKPGS